MGVMLFVLMHTSNSMSLWQQSLVSMVMHAQCDWVWISKEWAYSSVDQERAKHNTGRLAQIEARRWGHQSSLKNAGWTPWTGRTPCFLLPAREKIFFFGLRNFVAPHSHYPERGGVWGETGAILVKDAGLENMRRAKGEPVCALHNWAERTLRKSCLLQRDPFSSSHKFFQPLSRAQGSQYGRGSWGCRRGFATVRTQIEKKRGSIRPSQTRRRTSEYCLQ